MIVEVETFRLRADVAVDTARSADAAVQTDVAYQQSDLLRRTVAVAADGTWAVVTFWGSEDAASAAAKAAADHPTTRAFRALTEPASWTRAVYTALG
jgi:heme-degrading monooxygenase HmoA